MSYIYFGTLSLTGFILALAAGKKKKNPADVIFMILLLIFLINLVTLFILSRNFIHSAYGSWPVLLEFSDASVFVYGPLFYFYTLALTNPSFRINLRLLVHTIPFFVVFLFMAAEAVLDGGAGFGIRKWLILFKMFSLVFYLLFVMHLLRLHRKKIRDVFSNTEEKKLAWLNFLTWGALLVSVFAIVSLVINQLINGDLDSTVIQVANLSFCLFIFTTGYFGLHQNAIFNAAQVIENLPATPVAETEQASADRSGTEDKYKKSGLNEEKTTRYHQVLISSMQTKKPYLDQELSLFDLALLCGIQANHLSQVINSREGQNFLDFINRYRVEAVKEKILAGDLERHTLLGIALDCGFNSKASFNRAFKKHSGLTPTEFAKQASIIKP